MTDLCARVVMRLRWSPVLAAGCLLVLLPGCVPTSFLITPVSARRELDERVVLRESIWAVQKLALVDVEGVIVNASGTTLLGIARENPVSLFAEKLEKAAKDPAVRAVVVRINSPGGAVTASDLMYQELRRFRARTDKPVIAAMLDTGASGAYYLARAADRIYAQPTTVTGSIGVIMLAPEFTGTMEKIGMGMNVIKSGKLKDMASPFREMSEEDRAVLQGLIDGMYERFLDVVAAARPGIPRDKLRALADGRVYLGPQARKLGLVDEVGSLEQALAAAKVAADLADKPIKVVEYARPHEYRPNIYAGRDLPPTQVNLINVNVPEWLSGPAPLLMYMWAPGWN